MLLRWFPWRTILSTVARAGGLVDPVRILSRLESFAQPMEVKEPLELLRAGLVFHARGLLNTGAIQHNLDWVWPYWVERQYDPLDESFIPRAFSITHVNLSHRNWTGIGIPDEEEIPIIDPRGLVTPFWDSWSIDTWIVSGGRMLLPSRLERVEQLLDFSRGMAVVTDSAIDGMQLQARAEVEQERRAPVCVLTLRGWSADGGRLIASVRPYNPEGVSFIHDICVEDDARTWRIGRRDRINFEPAPDQSAFSNYRMGDVRTRLFDAGQRRAHCEVGMASGAASYGLESGVDRTVRIRIPLSRSSREHRLRSATAWAGSLAGVTTLSVPDERMQFLFDAAIRTLVLHSPNGVAFPGPYTYKRFWFRDAAFILHALMVLGLHDRVERVIDTFPTRQRSSGFFRSQEGEWDSNGEAIWTIRRFCELSGRRPKHEWLRAVRRGARWIRRKRLKETSDPLYEGLFPPGFSAEHLGPNDYYYWDDFWGVEGVRSAAKILEIDGESIAAERLRAEGARFLDAIVRSLAMAEERIGSKAMPASPTRRLDSGSIGSLAAGYPLHLFPPGDPRLLETAEFLYSRCRVRGGFFQDIIHSGVNAYLTLHLAEVFLRAADPRAHELVSAVAELASPTGQWPEAIHPRTGGGCMGDGHHVWAAAEWVLMLRNSLVREEDDSLILLSGVPPSWLNANRPVLLSSAPTGFGDIDLSLTRTEDGLIIDWSGVWRRPPALVEVRLPGFEPIAVTERGGRIQLTRERVV